MHLREGETVAVEGDTVDRCFLIEYGSVEVSALSDTGGHLGAENSILPHELFVPVFLSRRLRISR